MSQKPSNSVEMIPLLVFFGVYYLYGIMEATAALVVTTILSVIYSYYKFKTVPKMLVISALMVTVFGGLTLISNDEVFIKLKPTIIQILFAVILLVGLWYKKLFLRSMVGTQLEMSEQAWRRFTWHWIIFFLAMALLNELIWRNFSTDQWVQFKVFGILICTMIFMVAHIPFFKRHAGLEE